MNKPYVIFLLAKYTYLESTLADR